MISRHANRRGANGFTLIELMIVVVVIAILATIAFPSYQDSVRKSRRGQAKADLVADAQMLERYHTQNNTYAGKHLPSDQSPATGTKHYKLELDPDSTQSSFQLKATPLNDQIKDQCGTLTLNAVGQKGVLDKGTLEKCW
jgi:type IV pilus assembly protein PilE